MTIGVIILNFNTCEETINCVNSFLNQPLDGVNLRIVVVDNGSQDNSYIKLKDKFALFNVDVVRSEINLGFARGNNLGYKYLKSICECDFVIASNSDIELSNNNLFKWIISCYDKYDFSLLGPSIYSVNGGYYQNPLLNHPKSLMWTRFHIIKLKLKLILLKMSKLFIKKVKPFNPKQENELFKESSTTYTLHGAFQIFSKKYLMVYDTLYDENTFLYMEEDILKLRCDMKSLQMVYDNSYQVRHFQAVSTNVMFKHHTDKEIFRLSNILKSYKTYIKNLKDFHKNGGVK